MDILHLRKNPMKLNPLLPLSPRPLGQLPLPFISTPKNRPRSSGIRKTTEPESTKKDTKTLPVETRLKKQFVIKSSKEKRTPEKRAFTPSKQDLQTLFRKVDQEEEKDFLDLIDNLK
ncbi:hypothetical protein SteCoe_15989 [Stentor coeruleus]|uniref:Uncharacterized protein n=1 Tax=Stentor coeruleus TaxID=5963 RepID=A0A1R2C2B7_9CILI|nr:hypothetical protein SteCoe_15989 [Stentor coeruleus]